jgi:tight adherence protein B
LAVAAPWVVLALLSLRPEAVEAYDTTAGLVVLGVGGTVSLIAYRVMLRIGRLPNEERVLR